MFRFCPTIALTVSGKTKIPFFTKKVLKRPCTKKSKSPFFKKSCNKNNLPLALAKNESIKPFAAFSPTVPSIL
jgi:hypothetical protein